MSHEFLMDNMKLCVHKCSWSHLLKYVNFCNITHVYSSWRIKKPTRFHLLLLFFFLETQHVSGINMPETCWVSKKKNKISKWHLVGFLFFSYHNDAWSNKHQMYTVLRAPDAPNFPGLWASNHMCLASNHMCLASNQMCLFTCIKNFSMFRKFLLPYI